MRKLEPESNWIAINLLILIFILITVCMLQYLQPKGTLTCASFGAYSDIPRNWQSTLPQLDGNKNGKPCEDLLKHE